MVGSLLASDPPLAQRLIGKGIKLEPEQAIGWFNLGIGLHQQRKISAAIKAYKHCLALPTLYGYWNCRSQQPCHKTSC